MSFGPYGDPRVQKWNDDLNSLSREITELKAKLDALRAAAERVDQEGWRLAGCTRETMHALRAAIEASKK